MNGFLELTSLLAFWLMIVCFWLLVLAGIGFVVGTLVGALL